MYQRYSGSVLSLLLLLTFLQCLPRLSALRSQLSDSILDIINTKEVERLIAEREENAAREDKRYLAQNELDEAYPSKQDVMYRTPDQFFGDDDLVEKTENPRIDIDLLMRRNNLSEPYRSTELLSDLRGYQGRKVLKSSRNALLVTKKEYLKRDWCKTEPLVQKIKEEGCLTRTVINRFCYGQCNSFFIPKNPRKRGNRRRMQEETEDEDQNGAAFKSCAFCKPKKFTWITVTLRCPSMVPQFRKKRIQRIKQCKCIN